MVREPCELGEFCLELKNLRVDWLLSECWVSSCPGTWSDDDFVALNFLDKDLSFSLRNPTDFLR